MRGEQFLRKAISECKEYHLPESVTKPFKNHDGKLISWLLFQETVALIKQTSNGSLKSELAKGSKYPRPVLQRNDLVKKLIASKTQGIRRPFLESLKHRTEEMVTQYWEFGTGCSEKTQHYYFVS